MENPPSYIKKELTNKQNPKSKNTPKEDKAEKFYIDQHFIQLSVELVALSLCYLFLLFLITKHIINFLNKNAI